MEIYIPSLKSLSWAKAAILCLRMVLPTFSTKRWWSRKATRGDNTETSAFTNSTKLINYNNLNQIFKIKNNLYHNARIIYN